MKTFFSIAMAFANGCMIFMLSLLIGFYTNQQIIFEKIAQNYDQYLLGIFLIAIVAGGLSRTIYKLSAPYRVRVFLHYFSTIFAVVVAGIWLELVSPVFLELVIYTGSATFFFAIVWIGYYVYLRAEAAEINRALKN